MNNSEKTYVLGLTGQMAAGKSTVAAILRDDFGAVVISADEIGHELQQAGTEQTRQIATVFVDVLDDVGAVDRVKLRKILEKNPEKFKELNEIMHPAIRAEMVRRIEAAKDAGEKLVVVEVPLMFQTGAEKLCDGVLAVVAERELRLARAQQRNPKLTLQEFEMLDGRQLGEAALRTRADSVLDGGQSLADVKQAIRKLGVDTLV